MKMDLLWPNPKSARETPFFHLKTSNLVGLASGYDIDGEMLNALQKLGFGFVEIGSVTS